MRVVNLGSGSKGNATFIEAGNVKLLIDAGLSMREIQARLESINEKLDNIDAVIITHEHTDHIKSFLQILSHYKAHGYVHETVKSFLKVTKQEIMDKISFISLYKFNIGDVTLYPFKLPHDSVCCLGFIIEFKGKRVAIVTDLGYMPNALLDSLVGCSLVYIESNHDVKMVQNCFYPRIVKQRILSEMGHLSNDQAAAVIVYLAKRGTKYFVLSHLSENSNTIEKAYLTSAKAVSNAGLELEKDVFIRYSRQDRPGNNFYFGDDNE